MSENNERIIDVDAYLSKLIVDPDPNHEADLLLLNLHGLPFFLNHCGDYEGNKV